MRTILCHLNVEVRDDDPRDAGAIADAILAALHVGLEGAPSEVGIVDPAIVLAEEI